MGRRLKLVLAALLALVVLATAGFYAWTRIERYPAFPGAAALAKQSLSERGWYVFEPHAGQSRTAFIFYPGGLVDPAAYAPLMKRLADGGVLTVAVPMPLDLAVLGINRADKVISAYPGVKSWVIGGHSLGGAMAAEYVKRNPGKVDGIVFLGAYPASSTDLSKLPLKAVTIYGTHDIADPSVFKESLKRLPADTSVVELPGGNHAQFGNYGPQKGDGVATVSREEQQRRGADAILALVSRIESGTP